MSDLITLIYVLLLIILAFIARAIYQIYVKSKKFKRLSRVREWQPIDDDDPILKDFVPDFLRIHNRAEEYSTAYLARLNNLNIVFFHYLFTEVEFYRNMPEEEKPKSYTLCAVELPQTFDPILALTHHSLSLFAGSDLEKIKLEGDFNEYFSVLIPKDSEVDALSILTPDVMAIMMDNGQDMDLNINGHYVILSTRHDYLQVDKIDILLSYMYKLSNKLIQKHSNLED